MEKKYIVIFLLCLIKHTVLWQCQNILITYFLLYFNNLHFIILIIVDNVILFRNTELFHKPTCHPLAGLPYQCMNVLELIKYLNFMYINL